MTSTKLLEKWGSKEIWLTALSVRASLIWVFREEFIDLELGQLKSLPSLLDEAYLIGETEAARCNTNQETFNRTLEALGESIDRRINRLPDDDELQRLKQRVCEAEASDPLSQIFRLLDHNTKNIYGPDRCRHAALERHWLNTHPDKDVGPGKFPDPYHVNAETRVLGSAARIELQVHLDRFDTASLLAIPALLTHELVCHAHAEEDRNDDHSLWAEGVMDWVAVYFFEIWITKLDLPFGLTKEHGRQLRHERNRAGRGRGHLAADALVQWFVQDRFSRGRMMAPTPTTEYAKALTAKFALQVNVIDTALLKKDLFAARLTNIRHDGALQEYVRKWRDDTRALDSLPD